MAKSLNDLLQLKGAIGFAEFSADGKLIDYRSNDERLNAEIAAIAAQHAAAVSQLFNTLAQSQSWISGLNWHPQQGWAYWGADVSLVVKNNRGVFVRSGEADFNQIFDVLSEPWQRVAAESPRYRLVAS